MRKEMTIRLDPRVELVGGGRSITLKHGTGNLHLPGGDIHLDSPNQYAKLRYSRMWPFFWRKRWKLIEKGCDPELTITDGEITDKGGSHLVHQP